MAHSPSGSALARDRGASRAGCLLGLVILILGGYTAVVYAGSEIDFRQLRSEAQEQARNAAELDDAAIASRLTELAAELGLPQAAGQAQIRRLPGDRITITIQYPDEPTFFDRWKWVRTRRIQIDQPF